MSGVKGKAGQFCTTQKWQPSPSLAIKDSGSFTLSFQYRYRKIKCNKWEASVGLHFGNVGWQVDVKGCQLQARVRTKSSSAAATKSTVSEEFESDPAALDPFLGTSITPGKSGGAYAVVLVVDGSIGQPPFEAQDPFRLHVHM